MAGTMKDQAEINRLNKEITSAEDKISDLYGQIGFEMYKAYRDKPMPEIAELVSEIRVLHQKIADNKAAIHKIKTADLCPQCGLKVRPGMAFCSGCGFKLPLQNQNPEPAKPAFCRFCGTPAIEGMAFCTKCGKKLN